MKTLKDLKELVEEKERELAYGSETPILEAFVADFGYPSDWTEEEKNRDITDAYQAYLEAYRRLKVFIDHGYRDPYNPARLWD